MPSGDQQSVSSQKLSILICSSIVLIVAINVALIAVMQSHQSRQPDFSGLYQAGRSLIHERFPGVLERFPGLNGPDYAVWGSGGLYPKDVEHPPYELAIYASLALMKFRIAYAFWWGSNLVLLGFAAYLLWGYLPNLHDKYPYLLFMIATFFPVLVALAQGQTSILLLFLLVLGHDSLGKNHEFRAGFFLAMGMFKFVLVTPIVLLLILEKRWKSLAGFAVGCIGLFLLASWLVGVGGVTAYVRLVAGYGRAAPEKAGTVSIMPNLRGLVHAVGAGVAPEVVLTGITLILTLAFVLWVDGRILRCSNLSLRFSSQMLLAVLCSYHLYPHDASLLILPLAISLNYALSRDAAAKSRRAIVICVAFIYLSPLVLLPLGAVLQVSMPLIGLATLVLLAVVQGEFTAKRVPVSVR